MSAAFATSARAAVLFISPSGTPSGDGSTEKPLDLATALSSKSSARPGDVLVLLGGTYQGMFTSTLTGTEKNPIVVREAPGARAIVDGSLNVQGAWTTYWGFEVTNSGSDRTKPRPGGLNILGPHTRFINLVVHDAGDGMELWSLAADSEIYGCIIYHNGWQAADPARGSGHGIYTQNEKGTKRIVDNVIFDQYGWGIHAYTEGGALNGLYFEGNVAFNNGSATRQGYRYDNILIGGYKPAEHITVLNNYTYHTPGKGGKNRLGYISANKDAFMKGNYFAGGNPVLGVVGWERVVITENTFYGLQSLITLVTPPGVERLLYDIDRNTYLGGASEKPFSSQNQNLDFAGWQKATGFDQNSTWVSNPGQRPSGVKVFVRPNRYESGRATVIVYDWDLKDSVAVDLTGVLSAGDQYEVRNVRDLAGAPVAAGTYLGKAIELPMKNTETGAEFDCFVVSRHATPLPLSSKRRAQR